MRALHDLFQPPRRGKEISSRRTLVKAQQCFGLQNLVGTKWCVECLGPGRRENSPCARHNNP